MTKRSDMIRHAATIAVLSITAAACGNDESSAPSTEVAGQDATAPATEPVTTTTESVTTAEPAAEIDCSDPSQVATGLQTASLTSSGVEYDYQWTVPSSYDGSPLPVVLDFHGLGQTGKRHGDAVGWPELAEAEGFIAVQPSGPALDTSIGLGWQVPQFMDGGGPNPQRDDVGMVPDLLDHLAASVCVDEARIYSTGFSMGAMFTSTLVCELGDVIAAAVTVAGLNHHDECDPVRPVPFLAFHGTADTVTPMNGSKIGPEGSPERQFFEFEQIMPEELRQFADDFGCTETADSSVSESVTLTSYLGCDDDVEIGFYTIEGGGHSWPGSTVFEETPGTGFTTMEIDASAIAWDFFQRQSLPD